MSHFTTIETQVRDLDALREACEDLGLQLLSGVPCRGYAGATRKAAHVIRLKGPYDIAVEPSKEKDGTYGLTTDWWDGHVAKEVGTGYGRLLQTYAIRLRHQHRFAVLEGGYYLPDLGNNALAFCRGFE